MAAASVAPGHSEMPEQETVDDNSDRSDAESEGMEEEDEEDQPQQQASGDQAGKEPVDDPLIEPCAFESQIYPKVKRCEVASEIKDENAQADFMKTMLSTQKERENKPRGIQSLYNSSSSDCTLYSMFAFNTSFDYLFEQNVPCESNSPMRILTRQIVVPLRKIGFVGAKRTVALKLALQRVGGLKTKAIVDVRKPGRFMDDLLNRGLRVESQLQAIPVAGPAPSEELVKPQPLNSLSVEVKYYDNQDYITSQRLVEQWTLEKKKKLEKPKNLVVDLKRKAGQFEEPSVVLPMIEIALLDCLYGVQRLCSVCPTQNEKKKAVYECKECFDKNDDKHKSLCMCTYCEDCFHSYHKESEDRKTHTAIRVSSGRAANQAANDGASMQGSDGTVNFPYELYAVVCQNVTGYVAYTRTDIEEQLLTNDIKDYLAPIERLDLPAELEVPAASNEGDDTTKQKQPNTEASTSAAGANDASGSNAGQSSSSDSAGADSQSQDKILWVYYDPEAIVKEDVRGGYNVPQVYAVENFASLIDYATLDKSYGLVDPLIEDINKQHQYRLMCESVALFYRPRSAKK